MYLCSVACKNCCFSEGKILDFAFDEKRAAVTVLKGGNGAVWHAPDRRKVAD